MGENKDLVEIPTNREIIEMFKTDLLPVALEVYLKLMSSQDEKIKKDAADKVVEISMTGAVKESGGNGGGSISLPLDKIKGALVGLRMVDDGEESNPKERLAKPWDSESFGGDQGGGAVQVEEKES
jgi:hypothetical protein